MKAEEDFIGLISEMARVNGLGEVASRIIGILYIEPGEICLEELARQTGYSMAAVSTDLKLLANSGLVTRIKKPGSRKVFFFMEKDLAKVLKMMLEKKYMVNIPAAKEKLPGIIEDFKRATSRSKDPAARKKLEVLEGYYRQMLKFEKVIEHMLKEIDAL